jgi:putative endopeptidase
MEGIKTPPKKLLRATAKVQNIMNVTLSKKYLEYYRNEKQKVFCENLIEKMRNKFRERLQKNSWLNKKTIKLAIEKLDKMNMVIGYKNKWEDDPECVFLPNDAWSNYTMYSNWVLNKIVNECGKRTPPNNVWHRTDEMNVYDVNAFYNNLFNELIIPNAFLQEPFVNLDKNIAYNMAYIGTTIGHELTHAFDDHGCKYNGNGLYKNWWLKEDTIEYKKKQKMIIDQYEHVAKKDKVKVQGSLTLGENIADIGGFILAEETLEEILNESCIVGKDQDAYFKEFYYEYAKQWRSVMRKQLLKKALNHDVHSVAKYRVNCVLMRSERFKRIFNITPEDGMWFDNSDTIW